MTHYTMPKKTMLPDVPLPPPCSKRAFAMRLYPFCTARYALVQLNRLIERSRLRPALERMGCTRHKRRLSPEAQLLLLATHRAERHGAGCN